MAESLKPQVFVAGDWTAAPRAPATAPVDIRVLTWNVWFGGHMFEERNASLLRELDRRRPDVIALQEVTPELLGLVAETPWVRSNYRLSDLELWQGYDVLLLSNLPIRQLGSLELPTQMGRRLVVAELACGLAVATVHLESMKESSLARAAQLRLIQPYLAGLGDDTLLVGDMKFKPDDELETAALDPAFVDLWPVLRPGDAGFTADSAINTMRYALKPKPSQKRIDRVFLRGATWRPTAIELVGTSPIDIDGTFTSDHFGIEATLTVAR